MNEQPTEDTSTESRVNLASAATLFVAVVAIAVGLIGIAVRGTTPWIMVFPTLLGVYAILTMRKPR